MPTRGAFGFVLDKKRYQFPIDTDAYRSGWGSAFVFELKSIFRDSKIEEIVDKWKQQVPTLYLVDSNAIPTQEEKKDFPILIKLESEYKENRGKWCSDKKCPLLGSLIHPESIKEIFDLGFAFRDRFEGTLWDTEYTYLINLDTSKLDFYVHSDLEYSYPLDSLPNWQSD